MGAAVARKRRKDDPPPVVADHGPAGSDLMVRCPVCEAPPGEQCRETGVTLWRLRERTEWWTGSGRVLIQPHQARAALAQSAVNAQRAGTILRAGELRNYSVQQKYRQHSLDLMRAKGQINRRQYDAGIELHERWCLTRLSPEQTGIFVDVTPDPTLAAATQADREARYREASAMVPWRCKLAVMHVARDGGTISGRGGLVPGGRAAVRLFEMLDEGLTALADGLGY